MAKMPDHFSLKQEHPDSYEIHDARDNSTFHVGKQDLNLDMHAKLSKVKRFDAGGKADEPVDRAPASLLVSDDAAPAQSVPADAPPPIDPAVQAARDAYNQILQGNQDPKVPTPVDGFGADGAEPKNFDPDTWNKATAKLQSDKDAQTLAAKNNADQIAKTNVARQAAGLAPLPTPAGAASTGAPQVDVSTLATNPNAGAQALDPLGMSKAYGEMNAANKLQEAGVNEKYNADVMKSGLDQTLYSQQQQDLQKLIDTHAMRTKMLNDRSDALFQAASTGKIDPDNYWKNKGTGGRIAAGLGLLFSGAGAGQHGTNLAFQSIQDGINRDIEAQKANMSQKNNLFKMNMDMTHDENEAETLTRSDLLTMTAAKAQTIAAQVGGPNAIAQRDVLMGNLKAEIAKTHMQYATAGIGRQAYTTGVPMQAVPLLPPEQQKRMVPLPNGTMGMADSDAAAENVRTQVAPINDTLQALSRLDKMQASYKNYLPGSPERAQIKAETTNITNNIQDMINQKRYNDKAIEAQAQKFSDPSAIEDILTNGAATKQFRTALQSKSDSIYGMNVPAYRTQKAQGSQIKFQKR